MIRAVEDNTLRRGALGERYSRAGEEAQRLLDSASAYAHDDNMLPAEKRAALAGKLTGIIAGERSRNLAGYRRNHEDYGVLAQTVERLTQARDVLVAGSTRYEVNPLITELRDRYLGIDAPDARRAHWTARARDMDSILLQLETHQSPLTAVDRANLEECVQLLEDNQRGGIYPRYVAGALTRVHALLGNEGRDYPTSLTSSPGKAAAMTHGEAHDAVTLSIPSPDAPIVSGNEHGNGPGYSIGVISGVRHAADAAVTAVRYSAPAITAASVLSGVVAAARTLFTGRRNGRNHNGSTPS
ncbi:hypothetical protein COY95_03005 [Candidatus Woesearchaeota archaeon CG_4_10_14_0_8_um_filter_47_5]|nr:MAG: hypothetical protein COY95_03005 [Candidatus Woesearchaeota archaeon CG_4_10_14_0_8_um_filter_47_5]